MQALLPLAIESSCGRHGIRMYVAMVAQGFFFKRNSTSIITRNHPVRLPFNHGSGARTVSAGSPARSRSATPTRPPSRQLRAPPEAPVLKRPRALADAPQVVSRVMSNDGVVAGLIEVHGLVTRDDDFVQGIHQAVDDNAIILEQVIAR